MNKCMFCDKEGKYYGFQHCYFVCDDHIKDGEKIEENLIAEIQDIPEEFDKTFHKKFWNILE